MNFEDRENCDVFVLNNCLTIAKGNWGLDIYSNGDLYACHGFWTTKGRRFTSLDEAIKEFNWQGGRDITLTKDDVRRFISELNFIIDGGLL